MTLPVNRIICSDCLEVMKGWPDNCADLVLTDPPYGINAANYKRGGTKHGNSLAKSRDYGYADWDKKPPSKEYFREMIRLGGEQIFFGGNYFANHLPPSPSWIVWDKDNGNNDYADCELIWTSHKKAVRKVKWKWHGMFQENMKNKEKRVHPTQKPLGVMLWILERYSNPTDLILDPFCGSGTTCVAVKLLGRNYIGIDISEEYCEIARARLRAVDTGVPVKEQRAGQGSLFEDKNVESARTKSRVRKQG